jgi:hypothetical protein
MPEPSFSFLFPFGLYFTTTTTPVIKTASPRRPPKAGTMKTARKAEGSSMPEKPISDTPPKGSLSIRLQAKPTPSTASITNAPQAMRMYPAT